MSKIEEAKKAMTDARVKHKWDDHPKGQGSTGGDNVITGCIRGSESVVRTYPCHRPINSFQNAEALWSAFGYRTDAVIGRFYFDWLLDRSPWSTTGIIPDLDKEFMFQSGFAWVDLDKTSANLLHNFLVASRSAAEWPHFIQDWYSLIHDYGVNEDLAYFMMTVFCNPTLSVGGYDSFMRAKEIIFADQDKYDWPLDTYRCDGEYLQNFLTHKTPGKSKRTFYPDAATAPVNTLWGSVEAQTSYVTVLKKRYESMMTLKTIKGVYQNVSAWCLTLDNAITIIKEEELRLGLKKKEAA